MRTTPEQLQQWLAEEKYGLGISLFGGKEWIEQVLPHCRSGFVTINDIIAPTAKKSIIPFQPLDRLIQINPGPGEDD